MLQTVPLRVAVLGTIAMIPGSLFETDTFVAAGISELGPPLLIAFFLVNLWAWRRARPLPRPDALDQVDRSLLVVTDLEGVRGG